jgi:hypothetical protein
MNLEKRFFGMDGGTSTLYVAAAICLLSPYARVLTRHHPCAAA